MSGYIGSRASVVSSGAERKQIVNVTTTTTTISGVSYTPGFVDVFHNGIRLVQDTDFTATNGSSITLTNAAENGDQIVVKTSSTFSPADAVSKGGDTMTGDLTVPTVFTSMVVADSALSGFRNAIINGNFDHWQRGTSFTANAYGADRWINLLIGTAATQSRQAFTLGQTDVPNEPEYFCRTVVSSVAGAGNLALLGQRIEGVRSFAGQTVTLSFWAKADAAKNIAVEFGQFFGFGGSPSTAVTGIGVTTLALTTAWQKFTVTVAVPSISGKTLGTSNADYLYMFLWFDAGSDFNARTNSLGQQSGTFDIAQVQLEAGSVATPFERRPVGTELALCQRYFEIARGGGVAYASSAAAIQRFFLDFKEKRRAPSVVLTKIGGTATGPVIALGPYVNGVLVAFSATGASQDIVVSATVDAEL